MTGAELIVAAEALHASTVQPSDDPTPGLIHQAVVGAVTAYGVDGCAARLAQRYGDHPTETAARMRWCLATVRAVYPAVTASTV
ncbi:hypothetical protein FHR83_006765 [Actinoplanes campanulatus]|uniref:Uncharacterized protein n=1 Tax=Actinoplanes campanulatus TaxID=113559 RepID=A0A7W5ANJ0_9ACTN|nr:hypothetical protein [Actinoplanes campanulatus]MBB3099059.1 hypothetical protein [Actinoplanes campanulatus]